MLSWRQLRLLSAVYKCPSRYLGRKVDATLKWSGDAPMVAESLQLADNVIDEEQERALVEYVDKLLSRKRYMGDHWDGVIVKYRETELRDPPPHIQEIVELVAHKVKELRNDPNLPLIPPHVIDLHQSGYIEPHVDSIKFSGGIVAGLSLLSSRVIRLTLEKGHDVDADGNCNMPGTIEFVAYPRSVYILSGPCRYSYAHAILGEHASGVMIDETFAIERRMSLIIRDELIRS